MPDFSVTLSQPYGLGSGVEGAPVIRELLLDGRQVLVRYTTELPGGFGRLQVGGTGVVDGEPRRMYLPSRYAELPPLAHVRVSQGAGTVWEGRVIRPVLSGAGEPVGFEAAGYWHAMTDGEYQSSDAAASTTGPVLVDVIANVAPALVIGEIEDPQIPHARADFDGRPGGAIWQQVISEGMNDGTPYDLAVWEGRRVYGAARIVPDQPDYVVDLGDGTEVEVDWESIFWRVRVRYSDVTTGTEALTAWSEEPEIIRQFGVRRELTLDGGQLTSAGALALRDTYHRQHQRPRYRVRVSRRDGRGLRRALGGEVPPWLIRAGRWVQIPQLRDASGRPERYVIVRTEYQSGDDALTVDLNDRYGDGDQLIRGLQAVAAAVRTGSNPNSGARAS